MINKKNVETKKGANKKKQAGIASQKSALPDQAKPKRVGIMGGTFNPIHKGHIEISKIALKEFDLDEVLFIPSGTPPHKTEEIAPKNHRYRMVCLAIKAFPRFRCSKIELRRRGYSYAVDTFSALHALYGDRTKLYYIMGMDSINDIFSWKRPLELFNYCEMLVFTRPHAKIRTFRRLLKFPPIRKNKDKIHVVEARINISASAVREKLKSGLSVKAEVPEAIIQYIQSKNLYKINAGSTVRVANCKTKVGKRNKQKSR